MLYGILGLYLLQAFTVAYLMFQVNNLENRIKDIEGVLFDV